jgi:hypothetical protein
MKLDYSGAKTIEEVRAIKQAFWDQIHRELAEGKWKRVTREELERHAAEIRAKARKGKEEGEQEDGHNQTPSDNAA